MEFETVLQDEFWDLLTRCATESGDRRLYVQCDDEHVADNYGHAGVAEFDVGDTSLAYSEFLDLQDPKHGTVSLRDFADRLFFWGDSARWAFVGSRSVELCVGGHASDEDWPLVKTIRFHTFETVLELASGPYRKQLPADQVSKYEVNYRAKSWPITSYQEGA